MLLQNFNVLILVNKNSCSSNDGNSNTESNDTYKDASPSKFQCDFYEQTYTQKNNFNRHIKANHNKISYTCQQCGLLFCRSDHIYRLIKELHLSDDLTFPIYDQFDSIELVAMHVNADHNLKEMFGFTNAL